MNLTTETATINTLAILTGIDRRTVAKRLQEQNIQPAEPNGNSPRYTLKSALPAIYLEQRGALTRANERLAVIRAEKLEQEIEEKNGLANCELMRTDDVVTLFREGFKMLDSIKSRGMSEGNLSVEQAAWLEKLTDSIRNDWAAKLETLESSPAGKKSD